MSLNLLEWQSPWRLFPAKLTGGNNQEEQQTICHKDLSGTLQGLTVGDHSVPQERSGRSLVQIPAHPTCLDFLGHRSYIFQVAILKINAFNIFKQSAVLKKYTSMSLNMIGPKWTDCSERHTADAHTVYTIDLTLPCCDVRLTVLWPLTTPSLPVLVPIAYMVVESQRGSTVHMLPGPLSLQGLWKARRCSWNPSGRQEDPLRRKTRGRRPPPLNDIVVHGDCITASHSHPETSLPHHAYSVGFF